MIKIQLYNSFAGVLDVSPDAQGTEDFEQTLKRSDQTDGVVFEYNLDLQFTKQAKAYLRDVFRLGGGIEAVVIVNAFEYKPNAFKWEQIGTGTIKFANSDLSAESYKTSIEQTGFQRKVLNLMDIDVDLDTVVSQAGVELPATPYLDLELHSKAIIKQTAASPGELVEYQQLDVFALTIPGSGAYRERLIYGNIDTQKADLKEINESFALGWGWADFQTIGVGGPSTPAQVKAFLEGDGLTVPGYDKRINVITAKEAGVLDVELNLELKHEIIASDISGDVNVCGIGALGEIEIDAWYEHRDQFNNIKDLQHVGRFGMPNCGDRSDDNTSTGAMEELTFSLPGVALAAGDKIYVYETTRIYGNYSVAGLGEESVEHHFRITPGPNQKLTFTAQTITPPSTAKSYLVFEALKKTFQHYTDQEDCFRSAYYGRTDSSPAYPVDGPGSKRVVVSGANVRKVPGKTTFVNGRDFHGALNALDCLGMGFEISNGRQVVVVEPLSYFYNKDSLIMDLGPVSDLHLIVDEKQYANQIELNYGKIDIQKTNGMDDPNQLRRWKYPITQASRKEQATTKYKLSGYEIEDQRRKISSTEDSKNDENNFLIDLVRDGLTFKPRTNEDFTLIENLFSPETAYNVNLSPRRNLDNWLKVVAISLYLSPKKEIEFSAGEGNYFMVTQKTGEADPKPEGGPGVKIDLSAVAPLFLPERYKFVCPFNADQMALVRANPYGYFKFQEFRGGPDLEGYLSKIVRNAKKKLGTFELLKVFR